MNNPQVELNTICKLLSDKSPELLAKIDIDMFANKDLGNIFKLIRNFYVENSEFPGFDVVTSLIVKMCKTAEKSNFLSALILQVKERDITGLTDEILLKELKDYRKFRSVLDKAKDLADAVSNKDIELTLSTISSMYEDTLLDSHSSLDDNDAANLMGKKVKYLFRGVGIPSLDERGCLIEGGLTILAAGSGKGKSNMALQWDIHHYFNYEGSVAYFSYELSKHEIYSRAISNLAEVDVGNLMSDTLTPDEVFRKRKAEIHWHFDTDDRLDDFVRSAHLESDESLFELAASIFERRKNKFYIFDETCPFDELLRKMQLLRDTKNVRKFSIDYLTLVPKSRDLDKNTQTWQVPILHSEKLKMFAKEDGKKTFVVTPVQFKEKEDSIKFSQNIENAVDLYLKIKQSDDDKELGTVTVEFGKFRTYLTVKDKPLKEFKLLRDFAFSRFQSFDF